MNCGKKVDDKSKVNYGRLEKKLVSGRRNEKVVIEVVEGRAVSS